jgi:hypothetical protein
MSEARRLLSRWRSSPLDGAFPLSRQHVPPWRYGQFHRTSTEQENDTLRNRLHVVEKSLTGPLNIAFREHSKELAKHINHGKAERDSP